MKLVKISAIAVAVSALLAGPVLAQGTSTDTQVRGGARTNTQGGASGSGDEEINAPAGAAGQKAGGTSKSGMKGTVGSATGAPKGAGGSGPAGGTEMGR
jgi:hypothetical protein